MTRDDSNEHTDQQDHRATDHPPKQPATPHQSALSRRTASCWRAACVADGEWPWGSVDNGRHLNQLRASTQVRFLKSLMFSIASILWFIFLRSCLSFFRFFFRCSDTYIISQIFCTARQPENFFQAEFLHIFHHPSDRVVPFFHLRQTTILSFACASVSSVIRTLSFQLLLLLSFFFPFPMQLFIHPVHFQHHENGSHIILALHS